MAIGQWYDEFGQTTDEEVIALLDRAQREHRQAAAHRS
jgi:predicted phosphoribosyltransferase